VASSKLILVHARPPMHMRVRVVEAGNNGAPFASITGLRARRSRWISRFDPIRMTLFAAHTTASRSSSLPLKTAVR
jgi:hypothetical protein